MQYPVVPIFRFFFVLLKRKEILTKKKPAASGSTDVLVSTHPQPIVRLFFEKGPPLRLVAAQSDGFIFVWEWIGNEWVFIFSLVSLFLTRY